MIKPEPGIYRHLFQQYDLIPEESLFLDDHQENLDTASRMGMQTFLVTDEEMLLDFLKGL